MFVGNRGSGWNLTEGNNMSDNVTQCERHAQYACKSGKFSLHEIRAGMHPNPICCYLLTGLITPTYDPQATG